VDFDFLPTAVSGHPREDISALICGAFVDHIANLRAARAVEPPPETQGISVGVVGGNDCVSVIELNFNETVRSGGSQRGTPHALAIFGFGKNKIRRPHDGISGRTGAPTLTVRVSVVQAAVGVTWGDSVRKSGRPGGGQAKEEAGGRHHPQKQPAGNPGA